MTDRAAIVIGVDRIPGLEPLESGAKSAVLVGEWLINEGYDVTTITDEDGSAHAEDVRRALVDVVASPPKYRLLVVYFSGHGYWHARSDRWLFSGAPDNTADAINLDAAIDMARNSCIETVVFISDACRSIPGAQGQRVEGIDAFPNVICERASKVDFVKATAISAAAYEARLESGREERQSVLTTAIRRAYQEPWDEMVAVVDVDGVQTRVVPNRELEEFLQRTVDELLGRAAVGAQQELEVNIPSRDDVYLARVDSGGASGLAPPGAPYAEPLDAVFDAAAMLPPAAAHAPPAMGPAPHVDADGVAEGPVDGELMPSYAHQRQLGSADGFVVSGIGVEAVVAAGGARAALADRVEEGQESVVSLVSVELAGDGASVVLQLGNGTSCVLPVLRGYVGHVTVDASGVRNVSFVPSGAGDVAGWSPERRERLDRLRAQVALSVDRGQFRVSDADAAGLAGEIRVEKSIDPALGIYASAAYSVAGLEEEIIDVMRIMESDLGVKLFDVALLSSRRVPFALDPVPFCPMLTQSWSLLRPRGVGLPEELEELRPHLMSSLWTTFDRAAAGRLMGLVEARVLQ